MNHGLVRPLDREGGKRRDSTVVSLEVPFEEEKKSSRLPRRLQPGWCSPSFKASAALKAATHLVQKRSDGIVRAVQEQQQRRDLRPAEVKELVLFRDHLLFGAKEVPLLVGAAERPCSKNREISGANAKGFLALLNRKNAKPHLDAFSQPLGQVGRELVTNHGALLQGKKQGGEALSSPAQMGWLPVAALETENRVAKEPSRPASAPKQVSGRDPGELGLFRSRPIGEGEGDPYRRHFPPPPSKRKYQSSCNLEESSPLLKKILFG